MAWIGKTYMCGRCGRMGLSFSDDPWNNNLPNGWSEGFFDLEKNIVPLCNICVIAVEAENRFPEKEQEKNMEEKYEELTKKFAQLEDRMNRIESDATAEKGVNEDFEFIVDEFTGKVKTADGLITVTFRNIDMETGYARSVEFSSESNIEPKKVETDWQAYYEERGQIPCTDKGRPQDDLYGDGM